MVQHVIHNPCVDVGSIIILKRLGYTEKSDISVSFRLQYFCEKDCIHATIFSKMDIWSL